MEKGRFFDRQYEAMAGEEAGALDHPLYRYLLPYAATRVGVATALLAGRLFQDVLDLGCGQGQLLASASASFARYTGLDISEYQLAAVPEDLRARTDVTLRQADLDAPLPFGAAAFDLCVSLSTIEYVRDPMAFVGEAARVLRPGGTLLLHTMNLAFLPRRVQLLVGRLPTFNAAVGWQGGVLHQFTFPTLRRLVSDAGFEIEQERCAGLVPRLRMWWPNALASDILLLARRSGVSPAPSPAHA